MRIYHESWAMEGEDAPRGMFRGTVRLLYGKIRIYLQPKEEYRIFVAIQGLSQN
jgi:hypothetical protein